MTNDPNDPNDLVRRGSRRRDLFLVPVVTVWSLHADVNCNERVVLDFRGNVEMDRGFTRSCKRGARRTLEFRREVFRLDRGRVLVVEEDGQLGTGTSNGLGEALVLNDRVPVTMAVSRFASIIVGLGIVGIGSCPDFRNG